MKFYLIRHAHALDGEVDALRPLSAKGRRQIRRMVPWLRRDDQLGIREFWHSPLVRARDTARRFAAALRASARLVAVTGMEPDADPAIVAARLRCLRRSVAIFGHEPHLSALATNLLAGRAGSPVVVMKKCAVLALEREGACWTVRWLVSPDEIAAD